YYLLVTILIFSLNSCNDRITDPKVKTEKPDSVLVDTYGKPDRFEIATWNIENFPNEGITTVNVLSQLILDIDIDLIAVQEIGSISYFDSLLTRLPGWQGTLSTDDYGNNWYQKTGFLYKSTFISVSHVQSLFTNESWAFPRPPLAAFIKIRDKTGIIFDFNIIVLHLKAYADSVSQSRRKSACEILHEYINDEIASGSDPDFIVLGDWNDELDDPLRSNVFIPFLQDSLDNFTFLTQNLTNQYSYISSTYKSLIDNILITKDCRIEYDDGETSVLYLDEEYADYARVISDHRPVLAVFNGVQSDLNF
ncbi:MAG: endonuclease/exonuclease/phosphatase family protein, partial [Calditrichaceae bacterium]